MTSHGVEPDARDDEVQRLRKELLATRLAAFGFLTVLALSLSGVSRTFVYSAFVIVTCVVFFLGCRWGIGDTALSLGQSNGATLAAAAILLLLMLW
jgi:hypothetical protein